MPSQYSRTDNGYRFKAGSLVTSKPLDTLVEGEYAILQNVRSRNAGRITGRSTQTAAVATTVTGRVHSIRRLNDSTPSGPPSKYALVIGSITQLFVDSSARATGLSGNPISICPFRPNTSVQPWAYIGDSSQAVHINSPAFNCAGMLKSRSDGLTYKMGIAEPQTAPDVATSSSTTTGSASLAASTFPWTNVGGANSSYNFGHTSATDGNAPIIIATPIYGSTITVNVTGTGTVNGSVHAPSDAGSTGSGFPGNFIPSAAIVVGAFTDGSGTVVSAVNIGASATLTVPSGASRLQVGINSSGNTFSANSGSFSLSWTLQTAAIATVITTLGDVTAYYWGDSPHSGPVAGYIWKNPNDSGTGIPRSIGTAAGKVTNNSWQFNSTPQDGTVPVQWDTLAADGSVTGQITLFSPALESEGYRDFNACIVGSLFVPAAGTYTFNFTNKDQIMVGIGGGATVSGSPVGLNGQTRSVVSNLPLMYVSTPNGSGGAVTQNVSVTFPGPGAYQVEIDWDYWYHTGRILQMKVNGNSIPTSPIGTRTNVSYAYKYRSSVTGAQSNPSPASAPQATPVLDNTITPVFSLDPQVDKVDYYRQDDTLANYTYIGTGPNTNPPTPIVDTTSDAAAAANPQMTYDDFEPFPSIDQPKAGRVNVSSGVITWVSGDQFNTRWLPGTIIQIGSPTQLAYSFISRPTNPTTINLPGVPDGTNLVYNIAEPILAAQPLPSMWGPTDNSAYMFACGDPLRPGTLYYTKGNNPDSAPDTNQIEATSPSEPLMNGVIVNGIGMVFSTERAWLIYPTFSNALATVTGVQGQAFYLTESIADRGLYIRPCICTAGGKTVFFRAKDGIYMSPGGMGSKSITDELLYNMFPHEGFSPTPVTVAGFTIYPPDDTQPELQRLAYATGVLYYDYVNTLGNPCTLVLDSASGWIVDVYQYPVTCHALEEGPNVNDTLVGCTDGTVRRLQNGGIESATSVIATGSVNFGDARGFQRIGDVFVRTGSTTGAAINVSMFTDLYATPVTGFSPSTITGTGLTETILDFTNGYAKEINDLGLIFSWTTGTNNYVDLWQPSFIELPESTQDRPTDWDNLGDNGVKFFQGMALEFDSFGQNKAFVVEDQDGNLHTPSPMPTNSNGQTIRSFVFNPPFTARMVRIVSTDGVPWRLFPSGDGIAKWYAQPFPESANVWTTEPFSYGLNGWIHAYQLNLAYVSTVPVVATLQTDQGDVSVTFPAGGTNVKPAKILLKIPRNKWKVCTLSFSTSGGVTPFSIFKEMTEFWIKPFNSQDAYIKANPFGGITTMAAEV